MVAYTEDKLSFCLFRCHLKRPIKGMIRCEYSQVGGKHDNGFMYRFHDLLSVFLNPPNGLLCSRALGDLSLQPFISLPQAPLRELEPCSKLFILKKKLLF